MTKSNETILYLENNKCDKCNSNLRYLVRKDKIDFFEKIYNNNSLIKLKKEDVLPLLKNYYIKNLNTIEVSSLDTDILKDVKNEKNISRILLNMRANKAVTLKEISSIYMQVKKKFKCDYFVYSLDFNNSLNNKNMIIDYVLFN